MASSFETFDKVECHSKWLPELNCDSREVDKILEELKWQSNNLPGMRGFCLLAIAHLYTLPGSCDLRESRKQLDLIKQVSGRKVEHLPEPDLPEPDVQFLVDAMELKLKIMQAKPGLPGDNKTLLNALSDQWKEKSVQATCWVAKGWTMHWFALEPHRDAILKDVHSALKEAHSILKEISSEDEEKIKKLKVIEFTCLYALTFVYFRQRKNKKICSEEFSLWNDAAAIVKKCEWKHPIFLLQFAQAICGDIQHCERCNELISSTNDDEGKEKHYEAYIILPEIYGKLKESLDKDFKARICEFLEKGREIDKCKRHEKFFRREIEYLIYIKKDRKEAKEKLQGKMSELTKEFRRSPKEFWLEINLITLELREIAEQCQQLTDAQTESFLSRFEILCTNFPSKAVSVRLSKGIFLINRGRIEEGMKCLTWVMNDYLHPAQSFKCFYLRLITNAKTVLKDENEQIYLTWIESQFETDSETYHVSDSIRRYNKLKEELKQLTDEQKKETGLNFINEHLGRLLMRKLRFEDAEQLFRSLPESLQYRNAMIADSLLCQAESLSNGDDVSEVCKTKLEKMRNETKEASIGMRLHLLNECAEQPESNGDDVSEVCKTKLEKMRNEKKETSIGMRLHLLNECAELRCKDSIHEALLLLEDIRKQKQRNYLLSQEQTAGHLFLHSTCVYEFCARLLRLREGGFHIERRRSFVDSGGDQVHVAEMLDKIEQILATKPYPRDSRLEMTQLSLVYKSCEEMISCSQKAERSIWHTLEESRKALDAIWTEFVSSARESATKLNITGHKKLPVYYPFAYKFQTSKANSDIKNAMKRKRFMDGDEVFDWMVKREEGMVKDQGSWHSRWCSQVNSDKHKAQIKLTKFNEDIKKAFKDRSEGPADVLQMAHFASEFVEEVRLVLLKYQYSEVAVQSKLDVMASFDWKLVCYKCSGSVDALRSRFKFKIDQQTACGNCDKRILLIREKSSLAPSDTWQQIRPRPRKLIKLDMCSQYSDIKGYNGCRRSDCNFAHGDAELRLWELERIGKFSFNRLLKAERTAGHELPPILCEEPQVYGGRVIYSGPEPLPARLPPRRTEQVARLCESLFVESECSYYSQGRCFEAHCVEEEQLWNITKKPKENWPKNLEQLIDKIEPELINWWQQPNRTKKLACNKCFEPVDALCSRFKQKDLENACLECDKFYLLVRENNSTDVWQRVRDRPGYTRMCERYGDSNENCNCRLSECDFAHGDVELKLWKLETMKKFSFLEELKKPLMIKEDQLGQIVYWSDSNVLARIPQTEGNKPASLCKSLFDKSNCRNYNKDTRTGTCAFAHCVEEEQLWNIMRKPRENWPKNLEQLIDKIEPIVLLADGRSDDKGVEPQQHEQSEVSKNIPDVSRSNEMESASASAQVVEHPAAGPTLPQSRSGLPPQRVPIRKLIRNTHKKTEKQRSKDQQKIKKPESVSYQNRFLVLKEKMDD